MGRLEDIAERNRQAMGKDNAVVRIAAKIGGDGAPAEPERPFTLPSQRRSGTQVWKVLVVMLVLGIAFGVYSCQMAKRDEAARLGGGS